jgi:hypothetical protein
MDPDHQRPSRPGPPQMNEAPMHRRAQRRTRHRIRPCPRASPPDCSPVAASRLVAGLSGASCRDADAAPDAAPRRAGRFQRSGVRPAADRGRGPGATRSAVPLGLGAADRLAAACSPPQASSWARCVTSRRRRCRPGSTSRRCTGSTRRRYGCATAGGWALVSPAVSAARSPRSPLRSDAAAATRR